VQAAHEEWVLVGAEGRDVDDAADAGVACGVDQGGLVGDFRREEEEGVGAVEGRGEGLGAVEVEGNGGCAVDGGGVR
jgi:hypothetical protein